MLTVATTPQVSIVSDVSEFLQLREEWSALLHHSAADGPFLTWEWLHSWWTRLAGGSRLRIVTVRTGNELTAIAPLRLTRTLSVFPQLEFLGTGCAGSDYLDVIARRGAEGESLTAIARALETQGLSMHLAHLGPQALALQLPAHLRREGWSSWESRNAVCPFIHLDGHSWDSYLATLGSAHRANVRRRLRALESRFQVRFERVASESYRRDAMATLFDLHNQRWGSESTAFSTEALRAFHDEATARALSAGWLRLYVLSLDGVPCAVMYALAYGGTFYFFQHGFDGRYREHSIGLVLMALTIRAAIDEGAREFDLLYGNEGYKSLWAHAQRPVTQLRLFPAHAAGTLHRRTFQTRQTVRNFIRRIVPAGGGRRAA